jgi:hypothetical protein
MSVRFNGSPLKNRIRKLCRACAAPAIAELLESRFLLSGSPTVTLAIAASDGNWTAYASDQLGNNAGLDSFDLNVIGSDGLSVISSFNDAPTGSAEIDDRFTQAGFSEFASNGNGDTGDGGNGENITAGQNTLGTVGGVIQTFGQASGSTYGLTWTQTSMGVDIASGTYSGNSGILTASEDSADGEFQTLNIVSNGMWVGPSNTSFDTVVPGSVTLGPPHLAFASQPQPTTTGSIIPSFAVDVDDASGNVITTDDSQVTLAINSGPNEDQLSGTTTVTAQSGMATFSGLSFSPAGTYTLIATDGTLGSATSSQFDIAPAATQVVFVTEPASVVAGSTDSLVVDLEDQSGNIANLNNSQVTLTIASGPSGAVLGGTTTISATNGQTTFSGLTLHTAGTYTLTATDGTLSSATSSQFTISPAAPASVEFEVPPSNVTAGADFSPQIAVEVLDAFGNVETNNSTNVSIAKLAGPGNGNLLGTLSVSTVNGIAAFDNVTIDTAGNYKIIAADGTLATATSGSFTVNPAAESQLVFAPRSGNATAGISISPAFVVDVEDAFGNIIASSDNISVSVAGGPSTDLNGSLTVAASNGIATFGNLSLNISGTYTLRAADGTLAAISGSFTVNPAAASELVFASQPSTATAGVVISPAFVVDVEDQFGNIVTGAGNITVSVASGPDSNLHGTLTAAANNGAATFSSLSLNTAGIYTLNATDGTLTAATSGSFTVNPATASQLIFVPFTGNISAGRTISPALVVDVEDLFGDLITTDESNISLSVVTGPSGGDLTGTTTVGAVNGVATFNNVALNLSGDYTLSATDGTLAAATSGTLSVNAVGAAQLAFAPHSGGGTAGLAISPGFVVDVEDGNGNLVTGDNSNVTLSIAGGPAGAALGGTLTVAAVNGVATFSSLFLDEAGNYTLSAHDDGLTAGTSGPFTISASTGSQLVFASTVPATTAGVAINPAVVVDVEDQFGNLAAADDSTVTLSTIGGTKTIAAVNGVATFDNFVLTKSGNYQLSASDGTLSGATSNSFLVNPAAASQLVFATQPVNNLAGGTDAAVVVNVEDTFGNLVTSDNESLTVSFAPGSSSGVLSGPLHSNAVNGVATFMGLSVNSVGTFALAVSDGSGLPTADSDSFTVGTAFLPWKRVFTEQPDSAQAGSSIGTVTVEIENSKHTLVPTNGATISLALAGAKGAQLDGNSMAVLVNGVATFSGLSVANDDGSFTLKATGVKLTSATSKSFKITPSQLAFGTVPSAPVTAGAKIAPIIVDVESSTGGLIQNATSAVKLSVLNSLGTVVATRSVSARMGIATFSNLTLDTAGTYSLRAAGTSLNSIVSNTFTVVASQTASKLAFAALPPASLTTGIASSPIDVSVEDKFGNVITDSDLTVTLALSPNPTGGDSVLPGNSLSAINGVATFTSVTVNTPGRYEFVATAGGVKALRSRQLTVS